MTNMAHFILDEIKTKQLIWFVHLLIMETERLPKMTFKRLAAGKGGRPARILDENCLLYTSSLFSNIVFLVSSGIAGYDFYSVLLKF